MASSWRYVLGKGKDTENVEKGAQIDLLIDRADRTINLCEMKFSTAPFRISDAYKQSLRVRMEVFRTQAKTTKSLVNTFVTTFGVADDVHRSIVHGEVTKDDLFA